MFAVGAVASLSFSSLTFLNFHTIEVKSCVSPVFLGTAYFFMQRAEEWLYGEDSLSAVCRHVCSCVSRHGCLHVCRLVSVHVCVHLHTSSFVLYYSPSPKVPLLDENGHHVWQTVAAKATCVRNTKEAAEFICCKVS